MRAIVAAAPPIPDWVSPAAADFIRTALQRHAGRRPGVEALASHPWVQAHLAAAAAARCGGKARGKARRGGGDGRRGVVRGPCRLPRR
jgi:hypothetical protein